MDLFLAVVFGIIGIAGLIFGNDIGVFIGLGLLPWQLIKVKLSDIIVLGVIIINFSAGIIYFFINNNWGFLIGYFVVMAYNYWGYRSNFIDANGDSNSNNS